MLQEVLVETPAGVAAERYPSHPRPLVVGVLMPEDPEPFTEEVVAVVETAILLLVVLLLVAALEVVEEEVMLEILVPQPIPVLPQTQIHLIV